jgi:hypothetical protein
MAINFSLVDTSIQGGGKTWDFTAFQADPNQEKLSIIFKAPAATPYASGFPSANVCYEESYDNVVYAYRYFTITDTKCERVGSRTVASPSNNIYQDPQIEYAFPMGLGKTSHDTWANSNSTFGGTYDLNVIGTGTLKLPGKTYSNVVLTRVVIDELWTTVAYFWYNADGIPLVQYIEGDGLFVQTALRFATSYTATGVAETAKNLIAASYINPVESKLTLTLPEAGLSEMNYTIVNAMGALVKTGVIKSGEQFLEVDLENIVPGVYFFSANGTEGKISGIKILKK